MPKHLTTDYTAPKTDLVSTATFTYVDVALGAVQHLTLAEDTTLQNPTNMSDGQSVRIDGIQDGVGGWAMSLDTGYLDMNGTLANIGALGAGGAFTIVITRRGSVYRAHITTQQ